MKNLFVLIALLTLLYYAGSAHSMSREEWRKCAEEAAKAESENKDLTKNLCKFYGLEVKECVSLLGNSPDEHIEKVVSDYFLHGIVIPKCGVPDEVK